MIFHNNLPTRFILGIFLLTLITSCSPQKPEPENQSVPTQTIAPLVMPSGSGGGVIAFASDRLQGNMELFLINADGTELTRITSSRDSEIAPAWSPDGSRLAYLRHRSNQLYLYVLDINQALANPGQDNSIMLSQQSLAESPPVWSADGLRLYYSAYQADNEELFAINADGGDPIQLTFSEHNEKHPAISPDGTKLIFSSDLNGSFDLFLVQDFSVNEISELDLNQLSSDPSDELFPTWSPEGDQILYTSTNSGNKDLIIMNWDGSDAYQLVNSPADEWKSSWSPDGKAFVYSYFNFDEDLNDLMIRSIAADQITEITFDNFDNWWPAWKP